MGQGVLSLCRDDVVWVPTLAGACFWLAAAPLPSEWQRPHSPSAPPTPSPPTYPPAKTSYQPYQSSHTNPSLSEAEQPIVEELRQWRARVDTHTVSKTEYSRIIRDIRPGEFFDLVCLVRCGGGVVGGGDGWTLE